MFSISLLATVLVATPPQSIFDAQPTRSVWVITEHGAPKAVAKTVTVYSTRPPQGHTHTCTSCGATWDHKANPTHTCRFCGGSPPTEQRFDRRGNVIQTVYVADAMPRPVKIATTKTVAQSPAAAYQTPAILQPLQSVSAAAGNCANGQCSNVSRTFSRWR